MFSRFNQKTFNSDGSWVCPAGVTNILVYGMGGGSGGFGGTTKTGIDYTVCSAAGVSLHPRLLTVVPNTTYTITIGAGGAGSTGISLPTNGSASSFGALATFAGAKMDDGLGGAFFVTYSLTSITTTNALYNIDHTLFSYCGKLGTSAPLGTDGGSRICGIGGQSGELIGGTPGNGNSSGTGANGSNAAANSGAGGGGGGNGSSGSSTGGTGGSGQIIVYWVE